MLNLKTKFPIEQYRLCYIDNYYCAYFTTKELHKQWGDDWNDAPFQHNAGVPYTWQAEDKEIQYDIETVVYAGDFELPPDRPGYSVEQINRGESAWLTPGRYSYAEEHSKPIRAGCTLPEFIRRIELGHGVIYVPLRMVKDEVRG